MMPVSLTFTISNNPANEEVTKEQFSHIALSVLFNKTASLPQATPNKWLVLATLAFGTFMVTLDSSIVNIALPSGRLIERRLFVGCLPKSTGWVV